MRLYLQVGFGNPVDRDTLSAVHALGFAGVRIEINTITLVESVLAPFINLPLFPLALINGGNGQLSPVETAALASVVARTANGFGLNNLHIEVINEPDLGNVSATDYRNHPERFAEAVLRTYDAVREVSDTIGVVSGGISNLNTRGLGYLQHAMASGVAWPSDLIGGFHRYPETGGWPEQAHDGFSSRQAEFERLYTFTGIRRVWCTESGKHTAPETVRSGWFGRKTVQFTDDQVADFFRRERTIQRDSGVDVMTWFQLNDGSDPTNPEHRFGIRRLDGTWKPVASALRDCVREV